MSDKERVIIVGGGWAGMAAAVELHRHHTPVTLLESARQPGGRARSVMHGDTLFDNGQHLLIGAYRETLRLLDRMGAKESDLLARLPLHLEVRDRNGNLHIESPALPAPIHLLWGLLRASGLSRMEKYQAIRMSVLLAMRNFRLDTDTSVAKLLSDYRQGESMVRRFWEPLCLATLNTPPQTASARVFLRVLKDSFSRRRHDADLLIPRVPLGDVFCSQAIRYLESSGHNCIETSRRVTALNIDDEHRFNVETKQGTLTADDVILATAPSGVIPLIEPLPGLQPLTQALSKLGAQPIITVYLYYPEAPHPDFPMLGMSGTVSQWLFDRAVCGQPGWYAVVISSNGPQKQWDNHYLIGQIQQELAEHLDGWPSEADKAFVIREKRATFECRVDIDTLRPDNRTPLPGLWLAGDYTDTGYPATLEGAVRSGVQCAHQIIAQRQSRH